MVWQQYTAEGKHPETGRGRKHDTTREKQENTTGNILTKIPNNNCLVIRIFLHKLIMLFIGWVKSFS